MQFDHTHYPLHLVKPFMRTSNATKPSLIFHLANSILAVCHQHVESRTLSSPTYSIIFVTYDIICFINFKNSQYNQIKRDLFSASAKVCNQYFKRYLLLLTDDT